MHVGMAAVFQNPGKARTDREVYTGELRLADLAEPLGFESVWGVEHHFTDYTMCPDVLQFLTYMAGRTARAQLGSMVVVLPWHDPMRVAEEVAMLDNISGGRLILGLGRGAGKVEFDGFRLSMDESRQRFVESAETLLGGLETGYCEYSGTFVKQPRAAIRPAPFKSFRGRTYAAAVSPESLPVMAKLGVGILIIPQKPWKEVARELETYRSIYREVNGVDAPPPVSAGWTFCDESAERAEEMARRYIGGYYQTVLDHYQFQGDHLARTRATSTTARWPRRSPSTGPTPWSTISQIYRCGARPRSATTRSSTSTHAPATAITSGSSAMPGCRSQTPSGTCASSRARSCPPSRSSAPKHRRSAAAPRAPARRSTWASWDHDDAADRLPAVQHGLPSRLLRSGQARPEAAEGARTVADHPGSEARCRPGRRELPTSSRRPPRESRRRARRVDLARHARGRHRMLGRLAPARRRGPRGVSARDAGAHGGHAAARRSPLAGRHGHAGALVGIDERLLSPLRREHRAPSGRVGQALPALPVRALSSPAPGGHRRRARRRSRAARPQVHLGARPLRAGRRLRR